MQNQSELSRTDSKICEVTYCHLDFKKSTQKSEELRAERKDATPMRGEGEPSGQRGLNKDAITEVPLGSGHLARSRAKMKGGPKCR